MVPGHGLHHLLAVDLPREARLDHAALAPQRQRVVEAVVVDLREHSEDRIVVDISCII